MAKEIGALATVQCSAKTRDNLKTVFDIAVNVLICAPCDVVCVGIKVLSRERLYYSLICVVDVFIPGCIFLCSNYVISCLFETSAVLFSFCPWNCFPNWVLRFLFERLFPGQIEFGS